MTAVANTDKMICPNWRVEMNHRCDKLVYTTDPRHGEQTDPNLGGFIEEFHTCPNCGPGASRHTLDKLPEPFPHGFASAAAASSAIPACAEVKLSG